MVKSTFVFQIEESRLDDQGCLDSPKLWGVLEKGREIWYEQIGLSLGSMYQQGFEMEIEDFLIHVRRLKIKEGQEAKLITSPVRSDQDGYFGLSQQIVNEKGIELASATFTLLVVSNMTMEIASLPEPILVILERNDQNKINDSDRGSTH